jgi:hypothetical protein
LIEDPSEDELYQAIASALCHDSKPIYTGPGAFTIDEVIAIIEQEEGRTISRTSALRRAQKAIKRGEIVPVWLVSDNSTRQPLRGYVLKAVYDEWDGR